MIQVAWWNLENLFDAASAPRDPLLASALAGELAGWTTAVRDRKIARLAAGVEALFDGTGPDLLGVCEAENEAVLVELALAISIPGRQYVVASHDSPDARGIDVSFLFDVNSMHLTDSGHRVVVKRNATRDLYWVELQENASGAIFVALGNHWPSRSGGQYASEPFRMLTGETVSWELERLLAEKGSDLPVLLMGDFNDDPFDRSMREYLLGTRDAERATNAHTPRVLNLMWPLLAGERPGTFRYGADWNLLDQFLATRSLLSPAAPVRVRRESVAIFRPAFLKKPGKTGAPRPFGRPAKSHDPDGTSDHFPITVVLETE